MAQGLILEAEVQKNEEGRMVDSEFAAAGGKRNDSTARTDPPLRPAHSGQVIVMASTGQISIQSLQPEHLNREPGLRR